jgi:hypothetical protein
MMSTEHHDSGQSAEQLPVHKDVSFEPRDLKPKTILWALFFLALTVGVCLVITKFVLHYTTEDIVNSRPAPPPVWQELSPAQKRELALPPEPRLQGVPGHPTDSQEDLREKIKADTAANERLGWIDQKNGIAQVPVEDAMKLIEQNGLSAVPISPAAKKK